MVASQFRQFWKASEEADVLINNAAFTGPALHIAERRGLPIFRLFPRVKAVVHHGGAGTSGAVATAGMPSVIIPAFFAQEVWGHILIRKGSGTMLARRELRVDSLAAALREVTKPEVRERAKALGVRASNEGGELQAADEIERHLREAA